MRYFYCFSLCLLLAFSQLNAQNFFINEDFNNASLPTAWTNTAVTGTSNWSFGIDASQSATGNNNLDNSALAFFDDDALGAANNNNTVQLLSPTFDNSSDSTTTLEFDYNFRQFNGIADSFLVDVFDGTNWVRVLSIGNDDCGSWLGLSCSSGFPHAIINISAYSNSACQVRFTYTDGNDWGWGIGLDNVEVWSPYPNDIGITSIALKNNTCNLSDSLIVDIQNFGNSFQTNFQIAYIINGGSPVSFTVIDTVFPSQTLQLQLPSSVSLNLGQNQITSYTLLSNDQESTNDSLTITATKNPTYALPYQEDFESSNPDWVFSGMNPSWQIGQPNSSNLSFAAGGLNAAVTNLTGSYNANEFSYITSPCLQLVNITKPILIVFDSWRAIENRFDGVWLEYSIDGGSSWNKVEEDSIFPTQNWYNNLLRKTWELFGTSAYQKTSNVLRNIPSNGSLQFRFVMQSDPSTELEGFAFDNFFVSEIGNKDIGLINIINPTDSLCRVGLSKPEIEIANYGADTIFDANFFYQVNGGQIYNDSLRDPILPSQTMTFQFDQGYNFNNLNTFSIKLWSSAAGDSINLNDTLIRTINNSPAGAFTAPYFEPFGSVTLQSTPGQLSWSRSPGPITFFGWTKGSGQTGSANTGPGADADGDGSYLYLESSGSTGNARNILTSPCINLDTLVEPVLVFAYHKYGSTQDMGDLLIEAFNGNQWIRLDTIVGVTHASSSAPWLYRTLPLNGFTNRTIKIRFTGNRLASIRSDMAIDAVKIFDVLTEPITLKRLTIDSLSCSNNSSIEVKLELVKNFIDSLKRDSLEFDLYENGALVSTELFNTGLPEVVIDTTYTFRYRPAFNQVGPQEIKVITRLTRNGRLIVDSLIDTIQLFYNQLPYFEGFENSFVKCYENLDNQTAYFNNNEGWYQESGQTEYWHVTDTSNCYYPNIAGAGAATAYSGTGPNFPQEGDGFIYANVGVFGSTDSTAYLYSPCFDLSSYTQVELEYYYHRYFNLIRNNLGILKLEVNQNNSWTLIDRIDTTWSNPTSPWLKRSIDISSYLGSNVQFRFYVDSMLIRYTIPPNTAIDAFKIFDPLVTDVETLETLPQTLALYPNPNNGEFTVKVPEQLIGKRFDIIDLSGKVLKSSTFRRSTEDIQIDAEKGVYILRVPQHGVHQKVVVY